MRTSLFNCLFILLFSLLFSSVGYPQSQAQNVVPLNEDELKIIQNNNNKDLRLYKMGLEEAKTITGTGGWTQLVPENESEAYIDLLSRDEEHLGVYLRYLKMAVEYAKDFNVFDDKHEMFSAEEKSQHLAAIEKKVDEESRQLESAKSATKTAKIIAKKWETTKSEPDQKASLERLNFVVDRGNNVNTLINHISKLNSSDSQWGTKEAFTKTYDLIKQELEERKKENKFLERRLVVANEIMAYEDEEGGVTKATNDYLEYLVNNQASLEPWMATLINAEKKTVEVLKNNDWSATLASSEKQPDTKTERKTGTSTTNQTEVKSVSTSANSNTTSNQQSNVSGGNPIADKVVTNDTDQVKPKSDRPNLILSFVHFGYDSDKILSESLHDLNKLAEMMKNYPKVNVEVGGHTDSKGPDYYNQKLSERRARSVVNYLVKRGVGQNRISSRGYGESRPIAPNTNPDGSDNPVGRAKNRRVEYRLLEIE